MTSKVMEMSLGDVMEAPPLMAKLGGENVLLIAVGKSDTSIEFDATYFGVRLGAARATVETAGVHWEWLP